MANTDRVAGRSKAASTTTTPMLHKSSINVKACRAFVGGKEEGEFTRAGIRGAGTMRL
jgi:hypothetical protein